LGKALEWEVREREEQLALLREEEERLPEAEVKADIGDFSFRHSLFFLGLSFVFLLSYNFWRSASGGSDLTALGNSSVY